jgi:hypothetical protein
MDANARIRNLVMTSQSPRISCCVRFQGWGEMPITRPDSAFVTTSIWRKALAEKSQLAISVKVTMSTLLFTVAVMEYVPAVGGKV